MERLRKILEVIGLDGIPEGEVFKDAKDILKKGHAEWVKKGSAGDYSWQLRIWYSEDGKKDHTDKGSIAIQLPDYYTSDDKRFNSLTAAKAHELDAINRSLKQDGWSWFK